METSFDRYAHLLEKNGVTSACVSKQTGIPQSTFSDWKKGKSAPKLDKMAKIAQLFDVTVEWLAYGILPEHTSSSGKVYYFDDATAQLAQDLFNDPKYNFMMSGTRKITPEQFNVMQSMLKEFLRKDGKLDDD